MPVELSRSDQIDLVRKFCQQCFAAKGMCVDFAIHDKGDGNPHVHILLTTRRVDKSGFTTKDRSWNDRSMLLAWRKLWADWCNHKLFYVSNARVDHRSYAEQGIDKIPQIHVGVRASAIEKKGFRTDKGSYNRQVILANLDCEIEKLQSEIQSLSEEKHNLKVKIIEEAVGCKFSEMVKMVGAIDSVKALADEMDKQHIRYHLVISEKTGQALLHTAKADAERITKMVKQQPPEKTRKQNQRR